MRKKPGFPERLHAGVVLADGAMGTYLHGLGIPLDRSFPELCLSQPALVERVHREYAAAGAEILGTNSYGAQRLQLERHALTGSVRRINLHAARLARQASEGRCYVAGVIGPLGRSLAPLGSLDPAEAAAVFAEQMEALLEGGVDLLMIETISDLQEFDIALQVARRLADIPVIIQKTFTEDGRTLAGELPQEVVQRAQRGGADVVGANCTVGPQRMLDIIERMGQGAELPLAAQPTAGLPRLVDGRVDYHAEPGYMARYARLLAEAGASIVGACCGSTPLHIAAMATELAREPVRPRRRQVAAEAAVTARREPVPLAERSRLAARLGQEFVVAVDLDLPRGHDLEPTLRHASRLALEVGVDTFVLSDALRARLVVHPLVVAYRLQDVLQADCIQVYSARDRNVLGLQSDMLAALVLGVRNVLVSVAEPASYGDYPTATTLSDVSPTGLVRILDSMNHGADLAGNEIGEPTAFVPLVIAEALVNDPSAERARLAEQVAAGAAAIVTRPVFDAAGLEGVLRICGDLGVPVLVGLLPLRSFDHAEYIHNEVPGLRVPAALRERIRRAPDPRAEGLAAARELLQLLPGTVAGVHIVPPYRKPERVLDVLRRLDVGALKLQAPRAAI